MVHILNVTFSFFYFIHTSTYFHTCRVSIYLNCILNPTLAGIFQFTWWRQRELSLPAVTVTTSAAQDMDA